MNTFGLNPEYPLSEAQWQALYIQYMKAKYPTRCNHYRSGFGVCGRLRQPSGFAHPGAHSYTRTPPNPTTQRKGTDMTNAADIRRRLAHIEADEAEMLVRKEALLAQLERIDRRPHEPEKGSVITFTVQYEATGPVYKYAAIRFGNQWALTGERTQRYSWAKVMELVESDYSVKVGARRASIRILDKGSVRKW